MALDQDLAKIAEFMEAHRAGLAERLAAAPASPVRDELLAAIGNMKADWATVMAGVKETVERHEEAFAAATAQMDEARAKIDKATKAHQAQLAKKPEPAAEAPRPKFDEDALHAHLRNLLLNECVPHPLPARPARVDPGSITDDLPAMDEGVPPTAGPPTLPLLPLLPGSVKDIVGVEALSARANSLAKATLPTNAYVAALLQAKLLGDVAHLLATNLPNREAVWWCGLCLQQNQAAAGQDAAAFRAAVAWVLDPTPEFRRAALAAGEKAGPKSAFGCLALAAGQSPVPLAASPAGATPAQTAAAYLQQAMALVSSVIPEAFVQLGIEVASGELSWKRLVSTAGSEAGAGVRSRTAAPRSAGATGHRLGKKMLLDLGLVKESSEPKRARAAGDRDDFDWETSSEWNSLGM